jgi:flap endonuclease-1
MSVDLSKLVSKRKIQFSELNDKTIAIDAYNAIYQFLSIIRQQDGTPLTDLHGNLTSHLSGLFYRTTELIEYGITPIYVFDGIPSILKQKTIEARMQRRKAAYAAWQEAKAAGELESARTHAQASTRIDKNVVESSKRLLSLMGIGYVNAPSEGEAQASYMCSKGLIYAAASQDYDTMLFGSPRVVRNLSISGRRKLPKKNVYITVEPELMSLEDTLANLGLSREQLIWVGIMLGTDFNEGIKGIGPKTALKVAKSSKSLDDVKRYAKEKFNAEFELDVSEVVGLFENPEVVDLDKSFVADAALLQADKDGVLGFMCGEHDFSQERIEKAVDRMIGTRTKAHQSSMDRWFK